MKNSRCFILILLILTTFSAISFAQKKDYKPGEKIEYKILGSYPEQWEEGTFVRASEDGRQPLVREKPTEIYKEGYERWIQWDQIRPLSSKPANKAATNSSQNNNPVDDTKADSNKNTSETTTDSSSGLLTQAEILSFTQSRPNDKKELVEMIKVRGLDFRFETNSDFYSKLNKFVAMTSDITSPLLANFGAPTKERWVMGSWQLSKTGAAVDYEKNNHIYRQGEIAVGGIGALTIKADGTYVWNAGAKDSTGGKWRKATKEEMKDQGGDGIVLLKAKDGEDWIVMHDRWTTLKGDWINIYQLNWRQIKERGWRGGKR